MDLDLKRNSHFFYANMHVSLKNDILGEFDNFFHGNKCERLDELIRFLENYIPRDTETLDNSHSLRTFYVIGIIVKNLPLEECLIPVVPLVNYMSYFEKENLVHGGYSGE